MEQNKLIETWKREQQQPFSGWDFSYLDGQISFTDMGAIVYYLKAIPWLVPGFSVQTHLQYLLSLQHRLESGEALAFVARKYLIEAHK